MTDAVAIQPIRLPTVSYGPFRLTEAVPWLMLAAAMRVLMVKGGLVWLFASVCSDIAIFLAFMLAARRMIELSDGKTALGRLSFAQQFDHGPQSVGAGHPDDPGRIRYRRLRGRALGWA